MMAAHEKALDEGWSGKCLIVFEGRSAELRHDE